MMKNVANFMEIEIELVYVSYNRRRLKRRWVLSGA